MRTIPFLIAEAILTKIIVRDIRDSALGDLWEAHNQMRKEGKKRYTAQLVTAWRIGLLLKASTQIYVTQITDRNPWLSLFNPGDEPSEHKTTDNAVPRIKPLLQILPLTLISLLFSIFSSELLSKNMLPPFIHRSFSAGSAAALLLETISSNALTRG
jgi:hypothetical protein